VPGDGVLDPVALAAAYLRAAKAAEAPATVPAGGARSFGRVCTAAHPPHNNLLR
jgi:hypothetical protein